MNELNELTTPGATVLWPAFTDPVEAAQSTFRRILKALSEPGTLLQMPHTPARTADMQQCLPDAAYCLALTLLDQDTQVWLSPRYRHPDVIANLRFHCGCKIINTPGSADFAFVHSSEVTSFSEFSRGTQAYPEKSTSVIFEMESLTAGLALQLSGPGIPTVRHHQVKPLQKNMLQQWYRNQADFPCGIDMYLTCGDKLLGIPRSTHVQLHEEVVTCASEAV
ncbi:ribophosphonate triphosphate synthase subunit [Oleiphilus messinensis]|uniref:Ribophosphonate triphosphate synthase subunit n=1 Tax=Oleiphilus messinensis TaxID=141451 RepID=A0A1Y0IGL2_9GAMM|nr:phosphonate C-P lyase system protein PhnH [Oleiphilus messinensis]ARU59420.1 ribophosphonate triphosphate synthase subunit [Oleiphilus messinensis]